MSKPEDEPSGGRVLFSRHMRQENARLTDAINEALAELQQQIREHLPDYMAQRPGNMLVAEWDADVSNGEHWRMVLMVGREPARKGAG